MENNIKNRYNNIIKLSNRIYNNYSNKYKDYNNIKHNLILCKILNHLFLIHNHIINQNKVSNKFNILFNYNKIYVI